MGSSEEKKREALYTGNLSLKQSYNLSGCKWLKVDIFIYSASFFLYILWRTVEVMFNLVYVGICFKILDKKKRLEGQARTVIYRHRKTFKLRNVLPVLTYP